MPQKRKITVWFVGIWSGYRSEQSHIVHTEKRRLDKELYDKLPKFFLSHFDDNTHNRWTLQLNKPAKQVSNTYSFQIDNFLKEHEE